MTSIKVLLNKSHIRKDGTYPLVVQIIHRRRKRLLYSPYHLHEENFDIMRCRVVNRRARRIRELPQINAYIDSSLLGLQQILERLEQNPEDFSVSDIVALYRSGQDCSFVVPYMRLLIDTIDQEGRTGTACAYRSTLHCLLRFLGSDECLTFEDLSVRWLNNFVSYLNQCSLKPNTVNFYLRILRAVYNRALREDIPGTHFLSPFQKIRIGTVRTAKRAISKECMLQIAQEREGNDRRLDLARDLFLFSFYSRGMPFVDMAFLKYSNMVGNTIYYARHKTGQPLSVKMEEPLIRLVHKYQNDGEYVLPILKSGSKGLYHQYQNALRRYNLQLKAFSTELNLPVPLTSYVARHSWATIARSSGIPVSVISEGLGHSSEKVTYTYLAALDPSVIHAANRQVMDLHSVAKSKKVEGYF
jgi:integrase